MLRQTLIASALVIGLPLAAHAQAGTAAGATSGAIGGAIVGGPVGAVVGGVAGAVVGGIADDQNARFHTYVIEEHPKSYRYDGDVAVGTVLPSDGIRYYEVPPEYGVKRYRYTVVNNRTLLVDPGTHRVVQVIE